MGCTNRTATVLYVSLLRLYHSLNTGIALTQAIWEWYWTLKNDRNSHRSIEPPIYCTLTQNNHSCLRPPTHALLMNKKSSGTASRSLIVPHTMLGVAVYFATAWRREWVRRRDCHNLVCIIIVGTWDCYDMMTSSNGNIFRVTGHLCGEFTDPGEFPAQRPVTRSFDVFVDLSLNKRLSKQSRGWWFQTQSRTLWRHCNEST